MNDDRYIHEKTFDELIELLVSDGIEFEETRDTQLEIVLNQKKHITISVFRGDREHFWTEEKPEIVITICGPYGIIYDQTTYCSLTYAYVALKNILNSEGYQQSQETKNNDVEKNDNVDHPSHYTTGQFETIDEMRIVFGDEEVKSFCKLNAWKYKSRAMFKGKQEEDLKKADWYLEKLKELEKKKYERFI